MTHLMRNRTTVQRLKSGLVHLDNPVVQRLWQPSRIGVSSYSSLSRHPSRAVERDTPFARQFNAHCRPFARRSYAAMANSGSSKTVLKQTLSPALLEQVRNVWFEHIESDDGLILPGQNDVKRWFVRDEDFDKVCVAQFQSALDKIVESRANEEDILEAIDTSSPLAWLSIILLLDQVPRNCYRGDASKMVFEHLDPLAEAVALRAIDAGVPTMSSTVRYRLAYRFWFLMPLMHSEKLHVHEKAVVQHEENAKDMENLLMQDVSALSDDERKCYKVLSKNSDAVRALLSNQLEYEKRHKVIIERFGRYPHRNQALGRVATAEEEDYLQNGGETFG